MAISKIILNGVTQMDVTGKTVTAGDMLSGVTALKNDGTDITGNIAAMTLPSASSSTSSGTSKATITPTSSAQYLNIPAGYLGTAQYYTIAAASGGASNVVTGTFKGTTTGAAMDVNIPYTGTGYPIALAIYPKDGYQSGSPAQDLLQRYAAMHFTGVKRETTAPTYATTGSQNQFVVYSTYKSSSSTAATLQAGASTNKIILTGSSVSSPANGYSSVSFKDSKTMSVFIAAASYGFAANIEYTYYVIYSS